MKRFALVSLEVVGWFLGAGLIAVAIGAIAYQLAFILAVLGGLIGVATFILRRGRSGVRQLRPLNRWRAIGVLWLSALLVVAGSEGRQSWENAELVAARSAGDEAYLARLRELRGEGAWLAELEEMAPDRYEAEQARIMASERHRAAAIEEREIERFRRQETRRACQEVEYWLQQAGTMQYQRDARAGVRVLSVLTGDCTAQFRPDGLIDVEISGIIVALADHPNPGDMIANAVVRPNDPQSPDQRARAICRIAWGPYDWVDITSC